MGSIVLGYSFERGLYGRMYSKLKFPQLLAGGSS